MLRGPQTASRITLLVGVVIGALLILDGCLKPRGDDYFPVSRNARYEYSFEYSTPLAGIQKGKMVLRSDGDEIINGKRYNKAVVVFSGIPGMEARTLYSRKTRQGIYSLSAKHKESPEYLSTPFPLKVGNVWTTDNPDEGKSQFHVISIETLELIDRKYENCLKVTWDSESNGSSRSGTEYFAPGIGLVKVVVNVAGVTMDFTLERYVL